MTGTTTITIRATTITSITLIYMTTIITMRNIDVDSNAKAAYVNYVNHNDDNCENYVVTGFSRENYSPEVRHITRPISLRCTCLSLSYGY